MDGQVFMDFRMPKLEIFPGNLQLVCHFSIKYCAFFVKNCQNLMPGHPKPNAQAKIDP